MRKVDEEAKLFCFHFSQKPTRLAMMKKFPKYSPDPRIFFQRPISHLALDAQFPSKAQLMKPRQTSEPSIDDEIIQLHRRLKNLGLHIDLTDISKKVETATSRLIGDPLKSQNVINARVIGAQFLQSPRSKELLGRKYVKPLDELYQKLSELKYSSPQLPFQVPRLSLQNLTTPKSRVSRRPASTRARIQDRSRIGLSEETRVRGEAHKRPSTSRGRLESASAASSKASGGGTSWKHGLAREIAPPPPPPWVERPPSLLEERYKARQPVTVMPRPASARSPSSSATSVHHDAGRATDSPRYANIEDDIITEEESDDVIIYQASPPAPRPEPEAAPLPPPGPPSPHGAAPSAGDRSSPSHRPTPAPDASPAGGANAPPRPASALPRWLRPPSASPRPSSTPLLSPRTNRREPLGIFAGPDTPGPGAYAHPPAIGSPAADRGGLRRAHPRLPRAPCALALGEGRFRPVGAAREAPSLPGPGHYGLSPRGLGPPRASALCPRHSFGNGGPARPPSISERNGPWTPGPGEAPRTLSAYAGRCARGPWQPVRRRPQARPRSSKPEQARWAGALRFRVQGSGIRA